MGSLPQTANHKQSKEKMHFHNKKVPSSIHNNFWNLFNGWIFFLLLIGAHSHLFCYKKFSVWHIETFNWKTIAHPYPHIHLGVKSDSYIMQTESSCENIKNYQKYHVVHHPCILQSSSENYFSSSMTRIFKPCILQEIL